MKFSTRLKFIFSALIMGEIVVFDHLWVATPTIVMARYWGMSLNGFVSCLKDLKVRYSNLDVCSVLAF